MMPDIFKKIIGMLMAENQRFEIQHGIMSDRLVRYNSAGDIIWMIYVDYLFHTDDEVKMVIYNPETKTQFTRTYETAEVYLYNIHWVNALYP